jgi:hypothetical protein
MMRAFHLSIGAPSKMAGGGARAPQPGGEAMSGPGLNFEIEDQEGFDHAQRHRFEPFVLGMDQIGIARRNIAKRHDKAVCHTLVPAFQAAIGAGDIIINSRNGFG